HKVYDPCCGSGGMFVQSERFVNLHQGTGNLSIYGQESNPTTWRLAAMNLAIRGIEFDLGKEPADTFHNDQHPHLQADYILANPPFNVSDWGGEKLEQDARWKYGIPPAGNANYAWIQHMLYHLAPTGVMGTVLANGSMSSNTGGEGDIRQKLLEADRVECMVALPNQLFFNTQIPVCLWFLRKQKKRKNEVLFIDARNLGFMADRTRREFSDADIAKIADTYHAWRGDEFAPCAEENGALPACGVLSPQGGQKTAGCCVSSPQAGKVARSAEGGNKKSYIDVKGFCKSATLDEIKANDYVLTPGRYVGVAETAEDDEAFSAKMARLTAELTEQMTESAELDAKIKENLGKLGWKSR
uniref:N-6 DNA methylase n=1 Tax=uncultured Treponema sp. TaxID=162155 RepID=UPI00259614D7